MNKNNSWILKRIMQHIKRYTFWVVLSFVCAFISVIATLYAPILTGDAINLIVEPGKVDFDGIKDIIVRFLAVIAITAVSQWIMSIINNRITYMVVKDIRIEAFNHLSDMPLSYIDSHAHGDIVSRIVTDIDQFADGLLMGFSQLFTGIVTIVGTLGFMLYINVSIALVVVVLTPLSLFVAAFIAKRTYKLFRSQSESRGELTSLVDEMIGEQKIVQAFGYEDDALKRFAVINDKLEADSMNATFYSSLVNPSTRFVNGLVYAAVGIIGAFAVLRGKLSVGRLTSFLSYANQYTKPFNEISGVITELQKRQPGLPYFDPAYAGDYPEDAPFTVSELEEIYPFASARSKQDPEYYAEAMDNTRRLQDGERGLYALWEKIVAVSVADMKRNYEKLDVSFDLWNGESSVHGIIPGMVEEMKKAGIARESQGALVIDVSKETDAKEIPPCIVLKSDGASLYTTTDLATIRERVEKYAPDKIIYITDKRQELHFTQVFRAAEKSGLVPDGTQLVHIGFGTMNGKDGKPFKTREGGVMRLETLIADIDEQMLSKISANTEIPAGEAARTAQQVALAALKYGDLSNQAAKDYIFDVDKFTSFEGDTGPYILYTIVRMRSILQRYADGDGAKDPASLTVGLPAGPVEKKLMMDIAGFNAMMEGAYADCAPHRVCAYIYQLSNDFNTFYHATRILAEEDAAQKESWIALLHLTERVLARCIDVLGFSAPRRM